MEHDKQMEKAFETGLSVVKKIQDTQLENIDHASRMIANAFLNGKKFL
jgi:phosphoheptose isomerase